ncbi:apolipoprotein N-acyltransferase [Candidatus Margulisiibacteriota bacterium]
MSFFLAIISGLLLMLCFPEYNLYWLIWIALVPLLLGIFIAKRWWQALLCGWLAGLLYFGGVFSWLKVIKYWVGPTFGSLAWISLVLFQSIFIALFGLSFYFLLNWLKMQANKSWREYLIIIMAPALWLVIEWLRAQGPFGVSTGGLVYSQYQVLPLIQISAWIGAYGISFIIVLINMILAYILYLALFDSKAQAKRWQPGLKASSAAAVLITLTVLYGFYALNNKQATGKQKLKVAIFQPNVPQEKKLSRKYFPGLKDMFIQEIKRYSKLQKVDLILLPETIVPELLMRDRYFIFRLKEAARTNVLLGTPTIAKGKIYNSMVLIDKQGQERSFYHKRHLVPFGEYLPFKKILYPFLKGTDFFEQDYSAGGRRQVLNTPWEKIACAICFESILPRLLRTPVQRGGQLIVVLTNDAWFKRTAGLEEHLSMSVLRAVENRRYLIQVANTGYSALVDPFGRIIRRSDIEKQQWITEEVFFNDKQTVYTRFGDVLVYLSWIFIFTLSYQWVVYKKSYYKKRKLTRLRKEIN